MLRLTLTGGLLTSAQLKAIAQIASELEMESVTLTPGRDLDLSGIPAGQTAGLRLRFTEAGLSGREIAGGCPGLEMDMARDSDRVGVREQEQPMFFAIGVPVLAGRLSLSQARKAADLAERYAGGLLQLTSRQNLLLLNVPKERVAQALEGLESVDLRVACSVYRRGLTACAEGAWERAGELLDYLETQVPLKEPLKIHFSAGGCNCEQVLEAEIGLQGTPQHYRLSVNGHPLPGVPGIPAGLVKHRLENLLICAKRNRGSEEPFREFFRRIGEEEISRLLSEEGAHPSTRSG